VIGTLVGVIVLLFAAHLIIKRSGATDESAPDESA
jgi:hypothetical protein